MNRQWYAVCTKPQHELKVAAALSKKGIDNFCPLTRKTLVNTGFRKKITWSPVFYSFVFVHISEAEFNTVLRTADVTNFMYWMGKPAVVAQADITDMEQFANRYPNVRVEKTALLKNAIADNKSTQVFYGQSESEEEEIIQKILPSLGYILTASREKNYRIINSNIERGRMIP